jgi:hypothetical protein
MRYPFFIILLVYVVLSVEVRAQDLSPREKVELFLLETGISAQLDDIPFIIEEQFKSEEHRFDADTRAIIRAQLITSFESDKIREDAINYVLNDIEQVHIQSVLDWLSLPLTQKMNELEMKATSSDEEAAMSAYIERIQAGEVDQTRINTILDFDELTKTTDNTVTYIADLYLALVMAMNPYVSSADKVALEDTEEVRVMIYREIYPQYKDVTIVLNLFTYREVSDVDLNAYINFYRRPEGEWFSRVSFGIFQHVLNQASLRVRAEQKFE